MAGVPRARPGQIKLQWANTAEDGRDMYCFRGPGVPKADANLLLWMAHKKHHSPLDRDWHPSLVEELEARGYDITTLKITVEKKQEDQEKHG